MIGVNADRAANDFEFAFKEACRREEAKITVRLEAAGIIEMIHGLGCRGLNFTHTKEIVGRKSMHASDRTIMVRADKAASDLNRELITALRSPNTKLNVQITVEY